MSYPAPIILSIEGLNLSEGERRLFASSNPLGFILFQRNCDTPDQVRALVKDLRECVGWHCPVLIDQEGGRVQRLKPPHWQQFTPAGECQTAEDAAGVASYIAQDLGALGIDVNCSPVLDLLCGETHDIIGNRAFSDDVEEVSEKGLSVCDAYLRAGITPIVKHVPGHGRATADSHLELPIVTASLEEMEQSDFKPFKEVARSDIAPQIWAMVAHVVFTALDQENAASVSQVVMDYIRKKIGVDQFLLADDIGMKALEKVGNLADRARKTLEAGCDATLYCAGKLEEMEEIMKALPPMRGESFERYERSRIRRRPATQRALGPV
ncbi:MAG: beta-N-acetylhexosaminidase [Alphaproteobacteria bacterium]|nr:beta-N-acetylhexosaminidase [Alphaproteobacteria bacterium]